MQGWEVQVPQARLNLRLTPAFPGQELGAKGSARVVSWQGSVPVKGMHKGHAVGGTGHVEVVG
jgi:hypothetical protein